MPKGTKICQCGEANGCRVLSCKACGRPFIKNPQEKQTKEKKNTKQIKKTLWKKPKNAPKIQTFPEKGFKYCPSCENYVGIKNKFCPVISCEHEFKKQKTKTQKQAEDWPDVWREDAEAFRRKLYLTGDTALYCLRGKSKKPNLTKKDIGEWAEDIIFNYKCSKRQYVSFQALKHQLRSHFQYHELDKAFRFLTLWNKNYAD